MVLGKKTMRLKRLIIQEPTSSILMLGQVIYHHYTSSLLMLTLVTWPGTGFSGFCTAKLSPSSVGLLSLFKNYLHVCSRDSSLLPVIHRVISLYQYRHHGYCVFIKPTSHSDFQGESLHFWWHGGTKGSRYHRPEVSRV